MNLGNKLYNLRKENHLSQEEVANKLHVTRQTISKWELGETSPDITEAKQLADLFAVSLDELVDHDRKNIIDKKMSNTERLAGIIIKILKGMGILLVAYLIFIVIAILVFSAVSTETNVDPINTTTVEEYSS